MKRVLLHAVLLCSEEMYSTHTPHTSIRAWTDFKFESLLYIIETKCVSEFDMLKVFGKENNM